MTQIVPNTLLKNISADTIGQQVLIPNEGWRVLKIDGNLGGGEITFQTQGNSGDSIWQDIPDPTTPSNAYSVLEPTQFRIYLGAGMLLRATLSNSVGADGVSARIF